MRCCEINLAMRMHPGHFGGMLVQGCSLFFFWRGGGLCFLISTFKIGDFQVLHQNLLGGSIYWLGVGRVEGGWS